MFSSINTPTSYQYITAKINVDGSAFDKARFWACQTFISAQVAIARHWLTCTDNHLAGNHTAGWWYRPWILWQFECNRATLWAISPWKLLSSTVSHHFLAPHYPQTSALHLYISVCGFDKKLSKMVENSASYALWRGWPYIPWIAIVMWQIASLQL